MGQGVRDFQSAVGQEARAQFLSITGGTLPDHVVACVAGGSNALGVYSGFLDDPEVALHAVEPLGRSAQPGQHAATLTFGRPGTLHRTTSVVVLQDDDGGPAAVLSIASGLAYPGVGPEMAMLSTSGRVSVGTVSDEEAVATFLRIARSEGIIPALESAHALAFAIRLAATRPPTERILVNLSGRGDKDVDFVLAGHEFSPSDGGSALDNRPATQGPTAPVISGEGRRTAGTATRGRSTASPTGSPGRRGRAR